MKYAITVLEKELFAKETVLAVTRSSQRRRDCKEQIASLEAAIKLLKESGEKQKQ